MYFYLNPVSTFVLIQSYSLGWGMGKNNLPQIILINHWIGVIVTKYQVDKCLQVFPYRIVLYSNKSTNFYSSVFPKVSPS